MNVRFTFTRQITHEQRRVIATLFGEEGLATREQVKLFYEMFGFKTVEELISFSAQQLIINEYKTQENQDE